MPLEVSNRFALPTATSPVVGKDENVHILPGMVVNGLRAKLPKTQDGDSILLRSGMGDHP